MTHEPECGDRIRLMTIEVEGDGRGRHCLTCEAIRAAYQRGREDAARDVSAAEQFESHWGVMCDRDSAIAAARGDGSHE